MRIGIATIFNVGNCGALLQSYALCEYLKKLGHDPFLFNITLSKPSWIKTLKRNLLSKDLYSFIDKCLPEKRNDLTAKADLYMVGSDQVWNPQLTGNGWDKFMLSFVPNGCKKVAFSSSFGTSDWLFPELRERANALLDDFVDISVRESTGVRILNDTFRIKARNVLDPCFLLDDYPARFNLVKRCDSRRRLTTYRLCYSEEWHNDISAYAKENALEWTELSSRRFPKLGDMRGFNVRSESVETWLQSLYEADKVITDSFHGMVFCLIFEKQFAVIPAVKGRSSRLTDLLSRIGLQDRYVSTLEEAKSKIDSPIDYGPVTTLLNKLRNESRKILKEITV